MPDDPNFDSWPPASLRKPTASGASGSLRFAYFAEKQRLLIETGGHLQLFDSCGHQIREVDEIGGENPSLEFISQDGRHPICELKLIN